ncbi:DUF2294 domain-containing protein [Sporolactobacillus shoreicorticis]|uniref:Na-translocating system protein MpsC family protein n=1 Tax=Sporolactobacillus shoreicorticis TaxID=1923877 RepID=A0ABW5S819_9BACL|nr:Na-translocating system protein MpsC family protein [Sporolactobacillus shoreicorticis]MCO7125459.1 DUF2294 domain-containing protein [Sporolactobacillus shoreicorticis]
MPTSLGEFKQGIMKEYNLVNQMVFKVGVTEQKVSVFEDKIIIVAKHKRIPVLEIIDEANSNLTEIVDKILIGKSKELLSSAIAKQFGLNVHLILKDYDPKKEVSGTLIITDKNFHEYGW